MPPIGRYLAIDLGDRRTGLAICDEEGILASPLETIDEPDRAVLLRRILETCVRERVTALVMGMPYNMDGSEGPRAKVVRDFATKLAAAGAPPVHFEDERLSSFEADEKLKSTGMGWRDRKGRLDASAAVVILESYLARVFGRQRHAEIDPGVAAWHKNSARRERRGKGGGKKRA